MCYSTTFFPGPSSKTKRLVLHNVLSCRPNSRWFTQAHEKRKQSQYRPLLDWMLDWKNMLMFDASYVAPTMPRCAALKLADPFSFVLEPGVAATMAASFLDNAKFVSVHVRFRCWSLASFDPSSKRRNAAPLQTYCVGSLRNLGLCNLFSFSQGSWNSTMLDDSWWEFKA